MSQLDVNMYTHKCKYLCRHFFIIPKLWQKYAQIMLHCTKLCFPEQSTVIKKFLSTPFHIFLTIPILSLPGGPGDVPIVSDQNTVCWYIGQRRLVDRCAHELPQSLHNAGCVYVQARCNGWVVSNAYTHFLFRDKGEAAQKSSSAPEGWHGSHGVLRREYQVIQYVMHRKWLKAINWNVCLDSRENTCNAYQHIHLIQIYTLKSWTCLVAPVGLAKWIKIFNT